MLIRKGKLAKYRRYNDQEKGEKHGLPHSPRWREISDRVGQAEQQLLGIIETIIRGFVEGDTSSNAKRRHLSVVLNEDNKK